MRNQMRLAAVIIVAATLARHGSPVRTEDRTEPLPFTGVVGQGADGFGDRCLAGGAHRVVQRAQGFGPAADGGRGDRAARFVTV